MSLLPFSIIIPVYNDELNISKCLDSVIFQTFKNFECLLINDGSTDNTPSICISYAEKDLRIRYFSKTNEGISKTRQFGIDNSSGKYTIFIDSDDWIESFYLESVYQKTKNCEPDIVFMDFYSEKLNGKERYVIQNFNVNNNESYLKYVLEGKIISCLWNVIIKKELYTVKNIKFINGINYGEDTLFIIELLLNNPLIAYIDGAYYHNTFNHNSYTRIDKKNRFLERIKFLNYIPYLLDKYNRNSLETYNFFPFNDKFQMLCSGVFSRKEYHDILQLSFSDYYIKNSNFMKYILLLLGETYLYTLIKYLCSLKKYFLYFHK